MIDARLATKAMRPSVSPTERTCTTSRLSSTRSHSIGRISSRAGAHARDIEQIIDQPGQTHDMAIDRIEPLHLQVVIALPRELARDELHIPANRGEWRAQLVRHHRYEFVLDARGFFERA